MAWAANIKLLTCGKPPDMPILRCRDVARREFDLVSGWPRPGRAHGFGGLRSPRQLPPFTSVVSGIFLLEWSIKRCWISKFPCSQVDLSTHLVKTICWIAPMVRGDRRCNICDIVHLENNCQDFKDYLHGYSNTLFFSEKKSWNSSVWVWP